MPTPGNVRITALSADPVDARVEMLQGDGTWRPLLHLTSVLVMITPDMDIRAVVTVLPCSVDTVAIPYQDRPSAWERFRGWLRGVGQRMEAVAD